ncbi:MAG: hypothetical protein MJZ52_02420 [Bacteroidales bacterium]|nr:hypothetical protein [Bacteroidales bacterium]
MSLTVSVIDAFKKSFEKRCVSLLVSAYHTSITNHEYKADWMENDFTSLLDKHIDKDPNRKKWKINCHIEHHLHTDKTNNRKGYANKESRIDMRLSTFSSTDECLFYVEAKRLKEKDNGLLSRYVDTGIDNYLTKKYPYGILVGYLIKGDVDATIGNINTILKKKNRINEVLSRKIHPIHNQYFESTHPDFGIISHFVFDFTV